MQAVRCRLYSMQAVSISTGPDDEKALEDNITITLNISVPSSPLFVSGDFSTVDERQLFRSTTITIVDDDGMN
jgi:hypothetical protein